MSEERIKIIEKKVDLLYKMHLIKDFSIKYHLNEFIPLFNLSVEMERPEGLITEEELFEMQEEVKKELNKLKSDYNDENISVKEHHKIPMMIDYREEKYKALLEIGKLYDVVRRFEETLREELLMINLKEKLGMKSPEEYDFRFKERSESDVKDKIEWVQERLKEYKEKFD